MIPKEMLYFTLSYAMILIIGFMLINFLSSGFFGTFLRVKASRGKKVLVEVHAVTDVYYRAGKFDGSMLKYTSREGKAISLIVTQNQVLRKIGLFCVITDEVTGAVLDTDFTAKAGGNSEDYDHLLKRVMMAPNIENMREKIMLGLIVLTFVGVIIMGIMLFNMSAQLTSMTEQLGKIASTVRVV